MTVNRLRSQFPNKKNLAVQTQNCDDERYMKGGRRVKKAIKTVEESASFKMAQISTNIVI